MRRVPAHAVWGDVQGEGMAINALLKAGYDVGGGMNSGMARAADISLAPRTCLPWPYAPRQGEAALQEKGAMARATSVRDALPSPIDETRSVLPATAQFLRSEALRDAERTLQDALVRFGPRHQVHHRDDSARGAARVRRHVPTATPSKTRMANPGALDAIASPQPPSSGMPTVSRIAPQWSIQRHYTLSQALRSLSSCRSPFKHAAQLSDDLHAYLESRPATPPGNNTLAQVGTILDDAANLQPQVFLMQTICEVARIGADSLDGRPLEATDMLTIVSTQRAIMGLRLPVVGKRGKVPQRPPMPRTLPFERHVKAVAQMSPLYRFSDWLRQSFFPAKNRGTLQPKNALENDSTGAELSVVFPPQSQPAARDDHARLVAPAHGEIGPADRSLRVIEPVLDRPSHVLSQSILQGSPIPPRASFARVGNVPFMRTTNGGGVPEWNFLPLERYRPEPPVPLPLRAEEGGVYLIDGREFVNLHGDLYPIRYASRNQPWLVDRRGHSDRTLPPLPLQHVGTERWTLEMPILRHDAGAHGARAGADGFIRIGGRRYIALAEITVEVAPPYIHNEVAIRHLAEQHEEALPDVDAEHFIRAPDGSMLLQGRFGFYPVVADTVEPMMRVQNTDAPYRYSLMFDLRTEEWHVCDRNLASPPSVTPVERPVGETPVGAGNVSDDVRTRTESLLTASRGLRENNALLRRPALRLFLAEAFDAMAEMRLHRGNRRDAALNAQERGHASPIGIDEMRSAIYALLPDANRWKRMTVMEKQEQAALAVDLAYQAREAHTATQQSAYCNEMADLLVAQMRARAPALRGHLLQIAVRDLPGTGLTHVTVLYAEDPSYFRIFGPLTEAGTTPNDLATMDKSTLSGYLWHYRDVLVILDPWANTKVLEPNAFESVSDLMRAFDDSLRLAGFTAGPNRDFRVQAVMPSRQ